MSSLQRPLSCDYYLSRPNKEPGTGWAGPPLNIFGFTNSTQVYLVRYYSSMTSAPLQSTSSLRACFVSSRPTLITLMAWGSRDALSHFNFSQFAMPPESASPSRVQALSAALFPSFCLRTLRVGARALAVRRLSLPSKWAKLRKD